MNRSVGVGQGRGDKVSFILFHNDDNELLISLKTSKEKKITAQRCQGATAQRHTKRFPSMEGLGVGFVLKWLLYSSVSKDL